MITGIRDMLPLHDGRAMPAFGLGVYQAEPGGEAYEAVRAALDLGYRHVDTARIYGNEADVGRAIKDSGVPREEIYVVTKVWNSDQGYDQALRACESSLKDLGLDRIDLYLIHWPKPDTRRDTWRALERLAEEGLVASIGVSNYTIKHLQEMDGYANRQPTVNQVEFHPFLYQKALLEHCRAQGIVLEAYSPLTRGERLGDARLGAIAAKHGRTPAQVLVRWVLQLGMAAIPKSAKRSRIAENADVYGFALDDADMQALAALDEGLRTCWDPSDLP